MSSGLVDRELASRSILAGQTMDALFRPGGWKVVGNRPSEAARFLPAYKMDTPQGVFVKDFLATRQRPATPEEVERLPLRLPAVLPVLPWTVRLTCALAAGAVAGYVPIGMGLSWVEVRRRDRSRRSRSESKQAEGRPR